MTIRDVTGLMSSSTCEAWVCPVNAIGAPEAGISRGFERKFPKQHASYLAGAKRMCELGMSIGALYVATGIELPTAIVYAAAHHKPTDAFTIPRIVRTAESLAATCVEKRIRSIAIPALGCGLGGLAWAVVRPIIADAFRNVRCDVDLHVPT